MDGWMLPNLLSPGLAKATWSIKIKQETSRSSGAEGAVPTREYQAPALEMVHWYSLPQKKAYTFV